MREAISIIENDILIGAHTADWHFGAMDPKIQYEILRDQFINPLMDLNLGFVSIAGDIFDHKFMSNNNAVMYAIKTVDELITKVIRPQHATLIILMGTYSHDCGQLKLFYHYMEDRTIDVRVVETIQFEYIKGAKVLCIPELSSVPDEVYEKFLFKSGIYNEVIMHGTIEGAVMGDNTTGNSKLFTIDDFALCSGPIISGHIHPGGCYAKYFYYCGAPYTWRFGEGNDKGFLISLHNLSTGYFFIHKERIESFKYKTINVDNILSSDPKAIVEYIDNIKKTESIDYIRVEFTKEPSVDKRAVIDNYYRNDKNVVMHYNYTKNQINTESAILNETEWEDYKYLFEKSDHYVKFAKFVNDDMGYEYITAERLKKIIEDEI